MLCSDVVVGTVPLRESIARLMIDEAETCHMDKLPEREYLYIGSLVQHLPHICEHKNQTSIHHESKGIVLKSRLPQPSGNCKE